jgi:hypothetical protein
MKATISFVLDAVRGRVQNLGLGELAARAVTTYCSGKCVRRRDVARVASSF